MRVEYLGYVTENGTVRPSTRKIDCITSFLKPKYVKQLQFSGPYGLFRKFIRDYALVARPMTDQGDLKLVVPKPMHLQIIRKVHENGHFGAGKKEVMVRKDYWIPDLQVKTERVIKICLECILSEKRADKLDGWLNPLDKGH